MLILNYSHPLTAEQIAQLAAMLGAEPTIRTIPVHINQQQPLAEQVVMLANVAELSPDAWQKTPLIINPPGLATAAQVLLAEIHGRVGHFPAMLRLRPVADSTPVRYEVAELVNLNEIRDHARSSRNP